MNYMYIIQEKWTRKGKYTNNCNFQNKYLQQINTNVYISQYFTTTFMLKLLSSLNLLSEKLLFCFFRTLVSIVVFLKYHSCDETLFVSFLICTKPALWNYTYMLETWNFSWLQLNTSHQRINHIKKNRN